MNLTKPNLIGLTQTNIEQLISVFKNHQRIEAVKVYGSRAKGNFTPHSDLDLAIYGETFTPQDFAHLALDLDDSDIPYMVDIQTYHDINNTKLKEHIDRVGIYIYNR